MKFLFYIFSSLVAGAQSLPTIPNVLITTNYSVSLAWSASDSPGIDNYKIYQGTSPGVYSTNYTFGNVTNATILGLTKNVQYYFAATAVDLQLGESDYSNEITYNRGTNITSPNLSLLQMPQIKAIYEGLNGTNWIAIGTQTVNVVTEKSFGEFRVKLEINMVDKVNY